MTATATDPAQYVADLESIFDREPDVIPALIACSPAHDLDNLAAEQLISMALEGDAGAARLARKVAGLSCVSRQGDGSWRIGEDVRLHLLRLLRDQSSEATVIRMREYLATRAFNLALQEPLDGTQAARYRRRRALFESALQRMLIPKWSERFAHELLELWQGEDEEGRQAIAAALAHLDPEIRLFLTAVPEQIARIQSTVRAGATDYLDSEVIE